MFFFCTLNIHKVFIVCTEEVFSSSCNCLQTKCFHQVYKTFQTYRLNNDAKVKNIYKVNNT